MGCELFGGVSVLDRDFAEIFRKFVDSCIAAGRHPKAKWVSEKDLALYCCDSATDPVPMQTPAGNLNYELTLPGQTALRLLQGNPVSLSFGRGKLELTFQAAQPDETFCYWKSDKYSPGAVVKQDDGKCHRCESDGKWGLGTDCSQA